MEVEIAALREKRKIKGMQRWKEDVHSARMGDRAALLFQNVSGENIDRTVIFEPGSLCFAQFVMVSVHRIVHFQGILHRTSKLHISSGFDTVMGQCQFLASALPGDGDQFQVVSELDAAKFAILNLEKSVYAREGSFYIASRLDYQGRGCRFVFHGAFLKLLDSDRQIRRFRLKKKVGKVERIENKRSLICSGLFKKETTVDVYRNMNVYLSTGEVGRIEGAFGKSGKVRVIFQEDLQESTGDLCREGSAVEVTLHIRKFVNDGKIECCPPTSASL